MEPNSSVLINAFFGLLGPGNLPIMTDATLNLFPFHSTVAQMCWCRKFNFDLFSPSNEFGFRKSADASMPLLPPRSLAAASLISDTVPLPPFQVRARKAFSPKSFWEEVNENMKDPNKKNATLYWINSRARLLIHTMSDIKMADNKGSLALPYRTNTSK